MERPSSDCGHSFDTRESVLICEVHGATVEAAFAAHGDFFAKRGILTLAALERAS